MRLLAKSQRTMPAAGIYIAPRAIRPRVVNPGLLYCFATTGLLSNQIGTIGRRLPVRVRFDQIGFAQGLGFLVYYVLFPNVELVFP